MPSTTCHQMVLFSIFEDESIVTVDQDARLRPNKICTDQHTGTSASAPIAAGVCALALEANPGLTWRDMQHLVVMTSRSAPLLGETGWLNNGRGRQYNHKVGYGLMDAAAMVELAEKWKVVPLQHICQSAVMESELKLPETAGQSVSTSMVSDGCAGTLNVVNHLEHVQCKISLTFVPRGNLMMVLTSPSGTRSTLLFPRPRDTLGQRFDQWPFLSVHFWGEPAAGKWSLELVNMGSDRGHAGQGLLHTWQMIWYGTEDNPVRVPRQSAFSSGGGSAPPPPPPPPQPQSGGHLQQPQQQPPSSPSIFSSIASIFQPFQPSPSSSSSSFFRSPSRKKRVGDSQQSAAPAH